MELSLPQQTVLSSKDEVNDIPVFPTFISVHFMDHCIFIPSIASASVAFYYETLALKGDILNINIYNYYTLPSHMETFL